MIIFQEKVLIKIISVLTFITVFTATISSVMAEDSKFYTNDQFTPLKNLPSTILSLAVVVLIIIFSLKFLGNIQGFKDMFRKKKQKINIIERQILGPRQFIYIIEVGGKCFLVGMTDNNFTVLSEIDKETIKQEDQEEISVGNENNEMVKEFISSKFPFINKKG
jgi:flagellar biosynthetic protein FliO